MAIIVVLIRNAFSATRLIVFKTIIVVSVDVDFLRLAFDRCRSYCLQGVRRRVSLALTADWVDSTPWISVIRVMSLFDRVPSSIDPVHKLWMEIVHANWMFIPGQLRWNGTDWIIRNYRKCRFFQYHRRTGFAFTLIWFIRITKKYVMLFCSPWRTAFDFLSLALISPLRFYCRSSDAICQRFDLELDDIVILSTDGLFDNVPDRLIEHILAHVNIHVLSFSNDSRQWRSLLVDSEPLITTCSTALGHSSCSILFETRRYSGDHGSRHWKPESLIIPSKFNRSTYLF